MAAAINPVSLANMDAQFDHPFAHRITIAKIAGLHLPKPNSNTRLCRLIPQRVKPFRKGLPAVLAAVPQNFYHGILVA